MRKANCVSRSVPQTNAAAARGARVPSEKRPGFYAGFLLWSCRSRFHVNGLRQCLVRAVGDQQVSLHPLPGEDGGLSRLEIVISGLIILNYLQANILALLATATG